MSEKMYSAFKNFVTSIKDYLTEHGIEVTKDMRLRDLLTEMELLDDDKLCELEDEFIVSIYNDELIEIVAENPELREYVIEVEERFGTSAMKEPIIINEAIRLYLIERFEKWTLEDLERWVF